MPNYDFTEEDFAPKSKFVFTEEDFSTPVKRNVFGESKQDLASKMIDARAEGNAGELLDKAINVGMWGTYIAPLRQTAARLFNIPGNEPYTTPPLISPEQATQPIVDVLHGENPLNVIADIGGAPKVYPPPQTTGEKIAAGAAEAGGDLVSGLSHPESIETMMFGGPGARLFQAQMIKDSPQSLENLREAAKTGDIKETTKAALGAAMAVGGPLAIEKGLSTPGDVVVKSVKEKPLKPAVEEAAQPKEEIALPNETPAALDVNVLPRSESVTKEVSAKESVKGIPAPEKEAQAQITPEAVTKMTPDEFNKFAGVNATGKGYELAKEIGTEGDRSVLDEGEKSAVAELTAGMKALEKATPEQMDQVFKDVQIINGKKQYFNEAKRMLSAMDDVKSGKSIADAAKEKGVSEKRLTDAVKVEAPADKVKSDADYIREGAKGIVDFGDDVIRFTNEANVQNYRDELIQDVLDDPEFQKVYQKTDRSGPDVDAQNVLESVTGRASKGISLTEDGNKIAAAAFRSSPELRQITELEKMPNDEREHGYVLSRLHDEGFTDIPKTIFTDPQEWADIRQDVFRKDPGLAAWIEQKYHKTPISKSIEKFGTIADKPIEPSRPTSRGLQLKQTSPAMGESGAINLSGLNDFFDKTSSAVKGAFDFVKEVGKEVATPGKLNDYRRAVLNWSAKLQRSFGEAASIQRDITKQIKDPIRRDAITNWIQANGDTTVLRQRAADSEGKLAKGYEAALTLTPEELAVANQVKQGFAALERRGNRYDVLNSHKDNYVPQIWDLGKGPTGSAMGRSLKQKFRFSKARVFNNFFEGEQADFVPKTKDISKLLPVYMHEMESVIAAREIAEDISKGVASDGRPLGVMKGVGIPVDNPGADKATLIMPKIPTEDTKDYKVIPNQPALEGWKWAAKDDAGNNIFLKADMALHPEAYNKLKNVLGKSEIKEWYQTPTSAVMAIPKAIAKGLDMAVSEAKKTMLGVLAPFHQVQEDTHALGHRVLPELNIPKIDLVRDAGQMDAARHGLMLQPDKASENQFMEGFKQSKVISKIPVIGPASDWYSNYLFNEYIPGLKYKTYQAILDRNTKVYAKDVAAGEVGIEDVKVLSAEQANAAFGHLNYADLGRNPTIQHIAQLGILAPDFFESRIRFAGQAVKGATGLKVGREQLLALATLALGQAAIAYTSSKITGGQWDEKHPFEMTLNGKRYTLRSVPEDIQKFMQEPRQFLHNRLSILGKAGLQYSSGVNYKGQKVTAGETTKELAQQPIPLAARGFMHIGELSGWDQLLGAVGLKVSKASPRSDIMQQARDWGMNNPNPKIKTQYERLAKETLPDSVYKPLRQSLESNDRNKIIESVREILKVEPDRASKEKRMKQILKEFEPFTAKDVKPFATRSKENEIKFLNSLDAPSKAAYRQAIKEQVDQYRNLTAALYGRAQNPPIPEQYREAYGGR